MPAEGERVADVELWTAPGDRRRLVDILGGRRALLVFYLFDWSST
jgi:peroxiredoxin